MVMKNNIPLTQNDNIIDNYIIEKPLILINNVKDVKQYSTVNGYKTNDKQDESNQITEKKERYSNGLYSRYQLNVHNYVMELHRALIKECKDYLLDCNPLHSRLDFETLSNVANLTWNAIKEQKVFLILGYFPKISEEMRNRGWVEKRDPYRPPINYSKYLKSAPNMVNWVESPPLFLPTNSENDIIGERLKNVQSWNILKDKPSDLIFVTRKRLVNWSSLNEMTTVSQIARHAFCSKSGLAQCLEPFKNAVTNLMFPRCHYIRNKQDYNVFIDDYTVTALVSTLKIIVQAIEKNKMIFSENGNIPYEMITFVKRCVWKFLNKQQAKCMDIEFWDFDSQNHVWSEFMNHYTQLIIDDEAKFNIEYSFQIELDVYAKCKYLLENVKVYCPQHYIDGNTNTWIIKPISNCSGHGIILSRDLNKIKEKIVLEEGFRSNFILQKYIERPLLINTCKIDLRQWFLVTNMNPIVLWMYKEGYVRFCAKSFSMKQMNESIHLSNVRLQMKYHRSRSINVPEECMWDYKELQNHLVKIGEEFVWDDLIFPGMSESIHAVLKASTDASFYRPKSFQLFGADFVITDNYIPYLIEINSIPGLNPSTSVIANLVPMLLRDIIKVVVDYAGDSEADTGLFVKIIPEISKSISDESVVKPPHKISTLPLVPTYDQNNEHISVPYNSSQWLKKVKMVNDKIAIDVQRQKNISPRNTANECYLGYNRDYLLRTATMYSDRLPSTNDAIRLNSNVLPPEKRSKDPKSVYLGSKLYERDEALKKLNDQIKKR